MLLHCVKLWLDAGASAEALTAVTTVKHHNMTQEPRRPRRVCRAGPSVGVDGNSVNHLYFELGHDSLIDAGHRLPI